MAQEVPTRSGRAAARQGLDRTRRGAGRLLPALLGTAVAAVVLSKLPNFVGSLRGFNGAAPRRAPRSMTAATGPRGVADAVAGAAESAADSVAETAEKAADAAEVAQDKLQGKLQGVADGAVNLIESPERKQSKAQLLSILSEDGLAKELMTQEGKPLRGRIDEMVSQMERLSPTKEPVYDADKLDGSWRVKYSGSYAPGLLESPTRELALFLYAGGFSPGNALTSFAGGFWGRTLGLEVTDLKVEIMGGGSDVMSSARLSAFGQEQTVSYKGEIMPLSSSRMSEEILSIDLPAPVGKIEPPLAIRRQLVVSYLDDDMMIVRDESGIPDVLVREPKQDTATPLATTVAATPVKAPAEAAEPVSASAEPVQDDDPAARVDAAADAGAA